VPKDSATDRIVRLSKELRDWRRSAVELGLQLVDLDQHPAGRPELQLPAEALVDGLAGSTIARSAMPAAPRCRCGARGRSSIDVPGGREWRGAHRQGGVHEL
jgi:hypothetical protein